MVALIQFTLAVSILLAVFVIGLTTRPQDVAYVLRRPGLLIRSLVSINVIMPLFACLIVAVTHLQPAVEIALIALSVSPIPPLLPKKAYKAAGDASYAIGLLVVAALLAVGYVPLTVHWLGKAFGTQSEISTTTIVYIMATKVLAPLGGGLLFHHFARPFAERIAKPLAAVASILLIISVLPILVTKAPEILSLISSGTLAALAGFVFVGLLAGHLLGGPDPANRTVLALTTSSRHPGVAAAIATANFPHQTLVASMVLLYLLVNVIISMPYIMWFGRPLPKIAGPAGANEIS